VHCRITPFRTRFVNLVLVNGYVGYSYYAWQMTVRNTFI